jgi:nucleotide-binding universal stress UspA family protein
MKTIIISDIKGKVDSIIPYGLNLAKCLESEVVIVHIIDTRTLQGVQSSYSDSQTIAPGNKLSHQKIIEREKKHAEMKLDKILSKEASKLNYPLKIKTIVEEGSTVVNIRNLVKTDKECILLVNSVSDGFIFHSKQEIMDTIYNIGAVSFLIPPGQDFEEFKNIYLISDLVPEKLSKIKKEISFFERFKPTIHGLNIVKPKNYEKRKLKSEILEGIIKDRFTPFRFEEKILAGNKYTEVLSEYIKKNNPDLIMNLLNKKSLFKRFLQKKRNEILINNTNVPVLLVK